MGHHVKLQQGPHIWLWRESIDVAVLALSPSCPASMRRHIFSTPSIFGALVFCAVQVAGGQAATAVPDVTIPPGANFDKAVFRLWIPPGVATVRAVVVLNPGSNGDGRAAVTDTVWQAFATRNTLALVATQFTDKPQDQGFIEAYVDVSKGSDQTLLDALAQLSATSKHAELATAPLLMWGMSAGGQFNYEFTTWKPERVMAFVVNKGGIYYSALVPKTARDVPGILFVGGKDLEFRTNTIVGLFAVNRRAGALWALAEEASAGHIVGRWQGAGISDVVVSV